MRVFVVRARSAPTDSQGLLAAVGKVLESTPDYSRTISFSSNDMRDIGGFHEQALLGKIATALDASRGMGKEESRPVESGITVRTISFERLVQELAEDHQLFVMDRKGTQIRDKRFAGNPCFLLTDHMPMPKKSFNSLERLGAEKLALGSRMLFASQCVVLIHHELDIDGV
jgi:tRNA (pseudouridine54-N1)-methyltransferase